MKTKCSNCQTENENTSKYCSICGYRLPILEIENSVSEIESKKTNKLKRDFNLKATLGFVISFVIVFFVTQSLFKPSFSLDKQLVDAANELNKNCPMNVDADTVLENTVAAPNKTFQYNYLLIRLTKAEIKIDTIKKYLFPSILENVRSNPQMKSFRHNKVTINYSYKDKNGVFVFDYIIKPEMYSDVKD
ncbi:zinc ribbon domain-containing protein [Flavobacterium pectinovorum]|uniref:Zinc ribbon domain-containing protein n=1 Tax=Flavobacterium pectinovorum TaxID=29533 RepID=A0A502EEZ9_9FLAO|nr:zinc ribbon domain-containing protein [Flavobacterium pectinovorum]TPG36295.1 zinc ribbon domain-containing protein [Flavobacterium pectinovorum]